MTTAHTASLRKEFETEYARLFARHIPGAAIEVMSWVVIATTSAARPPRLPEPSTKDGPKPVATRAVFDAGLAKRIDVPVYERGHLLPGAKVAGPCLVVEAGTSTYVSPSFSLHVDSGHALVMTSKT